MKNKKLKTAGVVALSAVLACGAMAAFGGCKDKGKADTLYVSIFCNASDAATNRSICREWEKEYSKKIGKEIHAELFTNTDKNDYYDKLSPKWTTREGAEDIIYLAPRSVRSYVETGKILDLTDYMTEEDMEKTSQIWANSINYYGYEKGAKLNYTMGQPIHYDSAKKSYVTDAENKEVGLYALPKDFSNFSTGYNKKFFSETLKKAYTSTLPTAERSVKGPKGEGEGQFTSKLTYTGASGEHSGLARAVSVYAVSGNYTNPYTGQQVEAKANQPAPIINVGVPTTYFPYNFFRFSSFADALAAGDPMAVMSDAFGGYTVTLPGFPDETFRMPDSVQKDPNAPYDTSMGHIVYTYAEYSALLWATTYYLNTFGWCNETTGALKENLQDHTAGTGGMLVQAGDKKEMDVIYGGEQYEGVAGAVGSVLYLLPWLASNDADLINSESKYCTQRNGDGSFIGVNANLTDPADWRSVLTDIKTSKTTRMNLKGETVEKEVQYGYNSPNFIETYAAFLALGSDWNGNPSGDTEATRTNNGWAYFRAGRSIFYGAGSWDAATRNEVDESLLEFSQMPTPVAEKYALYSKVKGANYEEAVYSNDPAASAEDAQRASGGNVVYGENDIIANQVRRQDKWAARMDSVGYAVNSKVLKYKGDAEWKKEGAVSLVMALTIDREAMKTLTYAGAQFPNFVDQCKEFFDYQKVGADGAFADMLTPEGWSTMQYYNADGSVNETVAAEAKELWNGYYTLAKEMAQAAKEGSTQTVEQYLNGKQVNGEAVKYDPQYKDLVLKNFAGDTTKISTAMKVLRMVTYTRNDRDLNIRMQYGLNAVRDSSMYTYNEKWMGEHDSRNDGTMMAYRMQIPVKDLIQNKSLMEITRRNPSANPNAYSFQTPFTFCLLHAQGAQTLLTTAYNSEVTTLG